MAGKRENRLNSFNFCFRFVFSTSYSFLGCCTTLNFSPTSLPEYSVYFFGENDSEHPIDDLDPPMDPPAPNSSDAGRCFCGCACCGLRRSMNRRTETPAAAAEQNEGPRRTGVGGEVASLRETIKELCAELEAEQNAAATAITEAMSMILRLQREKAEVEMELHHFRRLAEQRMAHDQLEIAALEDLLFDFSNRLHSAAGDEAYSDEADSGGGAAVEYPHIRCALSTDDDDSDLDIKLSPRTYELDTTPSARGIGARRSTAEEEAADVFPASGGVGEREEEETEDRVYMIDTVHRGAAMVDGEEVEEFRMRRAEMRLTALEQDRDEVHRTVASMRADIGQVVRLKGVARQQCKILEHILFF